MTGETDSARATDGALARAIITQHRRCEQLDNPVVDKAWLQQEREILDSLLLLRSMEQAVATAGDGLPNSKTRWQMTQYVDEIGETQGDYRLVASATAYDALRAAAAQKIASLTERVEISESMTANLVNDRAAISKKLEEAEAKLVAIARHPAWKSENEY